EPLFKEETRYAIVAIACLAVGTFLLFSGFHKAGVAGEFTYTVLENTFGVGFYLFALIFLLLSVSFLRAVRPNFVRSRLVGAGCFFISSLGMTSILLKDV